MCIHNEIGLVKLPNSNKGVAIATASFPHLCRFNIEEGTLHCITTMLEKYRRLGITPMAMTNCLNFGNPEVPTVMGDFKVCVNTMSEAAKYWDVPVVSGNVSFYNETNGNNILPTPVIGMLGFVEDVYNV